MEGLMFSLAPFFTIKEYKSQQQQQVKRNDSITTDDKESTISPDSPRSNRSLTSDYSQESVRRNHAIFEFISTKKSKVIKKLPTPEYDITSSTITPPEKIFEKNEIPTMKEKNIHSVMMNNTTTDSDTGHALLSSIFNMQSLPCTCNHHYETNLTVHHFQQANHIADGSNSNVYQSELGNKSVALKIMKDSISILTDDIVLEEFEREVDILSRLKHRNIVKIYGSGHIPSIYFSGLQRPLIALELLSNGTLSSHLKKKRSFQSIPYTKQSYLHIGKDLADALYYLHELVHPDCMLIHRDLKPDNIGFATDGTLKLMDFGLCIALKRSEHDHTGNYTLTGCTGSVKYMAPEAALNKPYNEKVDIYSFGITMYEVITGCIPFSGVDKNDFYERVVIRHFRPSLYLDDYERDIDILCELRQFIQSCWHHDAHKRPSAKQAKEFFELLIEQDDHKSVKKEMMMMIMMNNVDESASGVNHHHHHHHDHHDEKDTNSCIIA